MRFLKWSMAALALLLAYAFIHLSFQLDSTTASDERGSVQLAMVITLVLGMVCWGFAIFAAKHCGDT